MQKDDIAELTEKQLKKLDRYTQYEKRFPFYRMNIIGFNLLIKVAKLNTHAQDK